MLWPNAQTRLSSSLKTLVGFHNIGELIHESETGTNWEGSAGFSIKGHDPEKAGILACLRATEAVAAHGASLTQRTSALPVQ